MCMMATDLMDNSMAFVAGDLNEVRKRFPATGHVVAVCDNMKDTVYGPAGTTFVLPVAGGNDDAITRPSIVAGALGLVDHCVDGTDRASLYMLVPVPEALYLSLLEGLMAAEEVYLEELNRPDPCEITAEMQRELRRNAIIEKWEIEQEVWAC